MMVGFQCPNTGIPCIGEWDEEGSVLQFDIENSTDAEAHCPPEVIEETVQWCMRNSINCYSEDQGNGHLEYLGIKERLEIW